MPAARARARTATPSATPRGGGPGPAATPPGEELDERRGRPNRIEASYLFRLSRSGPRSDHGRNQSFEQRIASARSIQGRPAGRRQPVILPGGPLFRIGNGLTLPLRADERIAFEAAHGGIHSAAGQAGHLHDAEAVDESGVDRLEDDRRGV